MGTKESKSALFSILILIKMRIHMNIERNIKKQNIKMHNIHKIR